MRHTFCGSSPPSSLPLPMLKLAETMVLAATGTGLIATCGSFSTKLAVQSAAVGRTKGLAPVAVTADQCQRATTPVGELARSMLESGSGVGRGVSEATSQQT